jgi:hypothetical protein
MPSRGKKEARCWQGTSLKFLLTFHHQHFPNIAKEALRKHPELSCSSRLHPPSSTWEHQTSEVLLHHFQRHLLVK